MGIFTDVYGPEKIATLNIAYLAKKIGGTEKAGDDLIELGWFYLDKLPTDIAFKNDKMIFETIKKMKE